jgi:hypothetical protein
MTIDAIIRETVEHELVSKVCDELVARGLMFVDPYTQHGEFRKLKSLLIKHVWTAVREKDTLLDTWFESTDSLKQALLYYHELRNTISWDTRGLLDLAYVLDNCPKNFDEYIQYMEPLEDMYLGYPEQHQSGPERALLDWLKKVYQELIAMEAVKYFNEIKDSIGLSVNITQRDVSLVEHIKRRAGQTFDHYVLNKTHFWM